jgi:hypothetical protein
MSLHQLTNRDGGARLRSEPDTLRRVRRCLFLLLLPVFLLASCGGGREGEDVGELLDTAFGNSIQSADIKLDAELQVRGSKSFKDPLRIEATGPFIANKGKLPQADLTLKVGTDGDGQVIETGFLSTGDRAFVKFQDVYYEQPPAQVARTNRELAKRAGRKGSSLAALGLDPRSWIAEASDEGEERVAGVQTRHISGTLEVTQVLRDLNRFVRRSRSALSGAPGAPKPLTPKDIADVAAVVRNPTFDVYVGVDDDIIRRISGRIELDVPDDQQAAVGGIEGGTLEFSIEFRDVNGDQQIEAPARARPLSELTRSLGGAGALGDALSGATGGGDTGTETDTTPDETTVPTTPTTPATPTPKVPDGGNAGSGGAEPDAADFKAYAECLDNAEPEDTDALQRCTELLQR